MHTNDHFLRAIDADPREATLRLAYSDWLAECGEDDRAALIRVEEEMRTQPVFADRFWELKPRRNELRTRAGAEWCGRMRYGTECAPVFTHGIPDGWRERWRLIREFTERWHRVPMPDIGGRQAEIAEAEARLGRTLPPSVQEWIAFGCDLPKSAPNRLFHATFVIESFPDPDVPAVALYAGYSGSTWFALGVRYEDLAHPDPPVFSTHSEDETPITLHGFVTEAALWSVFRDSSDASHAGRNVTAHEYERLAANVQNTFPVRASCGNLAIFEMDDVLVALAQDPDSSGTVLVRRAPDRGAETLPAFLQDLFAPSAAALRSLDDIPF